MDLRARTCAHIQACARNGCTHAQRRRYIHTHLHSHVYVYVYTHKKLIQHVIKEIIYSIEMLNSMWTTRSNEKKGSTTMWIISLKQLTKKGCYYFKLSNKWIKSKYFFLKIFEIKHLIMSKKGPTAVDPPHWSVLRTKNDLESTPKCRVNACHEYRFKISFICVIKHERAIYICIGLIIVTS